MQFSVLDWVLIGLFSAAAVFLVLFLFFLLRFFLLKRQLKTDKSRRPKQKKKRKSWIKQIRSIEKKKKSSFRQFLVCFFIGASCFGGAFYTKYYQETNLSTKDSEILVQGYFLVNNIEEQLTTGMDTDNMDKVQANIYNLSTRLASYGSNTPDVRLSKDGRILLKRLYTSMKQLGLNLNGLVLSDSTVIEEYLTDIERVKEAQKKAFDHFRIAESSLKQDT